jgi:glutamyl-tRNA(Gln) amidotransferase subunit E
METAKGLKVGLEIHQQLDTKKLFCSCPSELGETIVREFERGLRPARGETGEVDAAAAFEGSKGLRFRYQMTPETCLVEADEEPPRAANIEAVEVALTVALLLGAKPVHEIHFMRKLVIDGSNTTGFQRTALIATDGRITVCGRDITIPSVCLEEDAARKVREDVDTLVYRLDRLGIPLVEVATGPDIDTPELAREVALAIGRTVRDTGRAKRGIGSVREDLNVSVAGGARVEIKGVQELNAVADYVRLEGERQARLGAVAAELRARRAEPPKGEHVDVTHIVASSKSKVISKGLEMGHVVQGIALRGFGGLLGSDKGAVGRLGSELAQHARSVGLKGLFHSDELPGYGITAEETEGLASALGCGEGDAFAIVVASRDRGALALRRIASRASAAIEGVPEETRDPAPDGTTNYSRPLPGGSRMYPETDVPMITVGEEWLARLGAALPRTREQRIGDLMAAHPSISAQMATQAVDEDKVHRFEGTLIGAGDERLASTVRSTILYDPNSCAIDSDFELAVFAALARGEFSKEAVSSIYTERAAKPSDSLEAIVAKLGIGCAGAEEVRGIVAATIADNSSLVAERGEGASGAIMGKAMKRLRGRADGRLVSETVREEIVKHVVKMGRKGV